MQSMAVGLAFSTKAVFPENVSRTSIEPTGHILIASVAAGLVDEKMRLRCRSLILK
jgi:hypothetical protein